MRVSRQSHTTNPAGGLKIVRTEPQRDYKREDFFNDVKKVVRKLPPDHPSRSDSQKR
jgi:hypothetical protein